MIRCPLATALLLLAPLTAAAQIEAKSSTWQLDDSRGSFCVWYLADPSMAPDLAPRGTVFAPAGAGTGLPAAVARLVRDEPQFGSWIPAALCVGLYGKVTVDGAVAAQAKGDRPVLVMTHAIAAMGPRGQEGAGYLLLELATDNGTLGRVAEDVGLRVERREVTRVRSNDGGDDAWQFQMKKAKLLWSGHPTGYPRVEPTQAMSFGLAGMRTTSWLLESKSAPDTVRLLVGQLRVEGKDDLAKALKASPIRAVGPLEQGGRTEWRFTRSGKR